MNHLKKFDIRNFQDCLIILKQESNQLVCECPVCGKQRLTINKKSGAYKCWSGGCTEKEIRDALAPLDSDRTPRGHSSNTSKPARKIKLSAPQCTDVQLARLPAPATDSPQANKEFDREHGEILTTTYVYSLTPDRQPQQWVVRTDWSNPRKPKGRDKTFRQWHRDEKGKAVCKKGDDTWEAYRIDEFIQALKATLGTPFGLVQEGERAIEASRAVGIASMTFQGSNWQLKSLEHSLLQIKKECPNAVLVYLKDNDATGEKKGKIFQEACDRIGIFCIIIDPVAIYSDLPANGDIVEILAAMETGEFIRRLEQEIYKAVEARRQLLPSDDDFKPTDNIPDSFSSDQRFEIALQVLLKESDPIKRMRRRAEISSHYRLSKVEIEEALKELRQRNTTSEPTFFTLENFLNHSEEPLDYIVPSMLPVGETVLLAAVPKVGKTLLAIDLAFAVATGEDSFLGEQCKRGRVLIISVDESVSSTRSKLLKRGFRESDNEWVKIMTRFDVSQMLALEERLESFRPSLVIIDSLRRINHGQYISENSAEFADTIYTLKELLTKYSAAGVLIHHTSKDKEAQGVNKVRGSSAITGAVWGVWQIEHQLKPLGQGRDKKMVFDPKDLNRTFSVIARDTEGQQFKIELDPEKNCWINRGENSDVTTAAETQTMKQRIKSVLESNRHREGHTLAKPFPGISS